MSDNLKRKPGSRKLWAGIASLATALFTAFNVDKLTAEQVTLIISGIGGVVVYMLSKAYVDGKREEEVTVVVQQGVGVLDEDEGDERCEIPP